MNRRLQVLIQEAQQFINHLARGGWIAQLLACYLLLLVGQPLQGQEREDRLGKTDGGVVSPVAGDVTLQRAIEKEFRAAADQADVRGLALQQALQIHELQVQLREAQCLLLLQLLVLGANGVVMLLVFRHWHAARGWEQVGHTFAAQYDQLNRRFIRLQSEMIGMRLPAAKGGKPDEVKEDSK